MANTLIDRTYPSAGFYYPEIRQSIINSINECLEHRADISTDLHKIGGFVFTCNVSYDWGSKYDYRVSLICTHCNESFTIDHNMVKPDFEVAEIATDLAQKMLGFTNLY